MIDVVLVVATAEAQGPVDPVAVARAMPAQQGALTALTGVLQHLAWEMRPSEHNVKL